MSLSHISDFIDPIEHFRIAIPTDGFYELTADVKPPPDDAISRRFWKRRWPKGTLLTIRRRDYPVADFQYEVEFVMLTQKAEPTRLRTYIRQDGRCAHADALLSVLPTLSRVGPSKVSLLPDGVYTLKDAIEFEGIKPCRFWQKWPKSTTVSLETRRSSLPNFAYEIEMFLQANEDQHVHLRTYVRADGSSTHQEELAVLWPKLTTKREGTSAREEHV